MSCTRAAPAPWSARPPPPAPRWSRPRGVPFRPGAPVIGCWYRICTARRTPMKSHKSAKRIELAVLGTVAIFVVLVVGTLVVRSRLARVEPLGPELTGADLRIKQAGIEEVTQGVRWRL